MTNQTFPWTYRAYGLRIRSEIQLPIFYSEISSHPNQVPLWEGEDEVAIHLGTHLPIEQTIPPAVTQQSIAVQVSPDKILLYIKAIGTFEIQQGQTIQCYPAPNIQEARLALALSGVVMAALLFQRGCFIAHGSAVAIAGEGVLFLGDSGAGKSSLAIALHQRGYPILTDDLAGIIEHKGIPYLLPAFPQMRVTEETATALDLPWDELIPLSNIPKRGFRFESEFISQAVPLRHIYVLQASSTSAPHCCSLKSHQQIMELMHHSDVMSLFGMNQTQHFQSCTTVAQTTPIDYFQRPMHWTMLQNTLNTLEKHVSSN